MLITLSLPGAVSAGRLVAHSLLLLPGRSPLFDPASESQAFSLSFRINLRLYRGCSLLHELQLLVVLRIPPRGTHAVTEGSSPGRLMVHS